MREEKQLFEGESERAWVQIWIRKSTVDGHATLSISDGNMQVPGSRPIVLVLRPKRSSKAHWHDGRPQWFL